MKLPRWRRPVRYSRQNHSNDYSTSLHLDFKLPSSISCASRARLLARPAVFGWFGAWGAPQGAKDVRWLDQGKPIERELSGGESHSYQLNITTGQYARVIIEQKGIDVVVSVFGPDGKLITAVDNPNGSQPRHPGQRNQIW